uniref:Uncharacterized protein n=1 Tax=uncultured marine virus TaxID=186617 RepID=A0A0F7L7T8_9VIRU|nr:hypothetical protein [uncultured marine virus]
MAEWNPQEKSGVGSQFYDENNLFYDALIENTTGSEVYYDGLGSTTVWTNLTKN